MSGFFLGWIFDTMQAGIFSTSLAWPGWHIVSTAKSFSGRVSPATLWCLSYLPPQQGPISAGFGPYTRWKWVWQAWDSYSFLVSYLEPGIQNLEWPPWLSRVQVEIGMACEVIYNLAAAWFLNLRGDYGYESAWRGLWRSCYLPPLHSAPATCHVPDVSCTATPPDYLTYCLLCLMWRLLWMLPNPKTKRQAGN